MVFTRKESEFLYEDVPDEIEKDLGASDTSDGDLQDETTGPLIIEKNQKLFKHNGYGVLLEGSI